MGAVDASDHYLIERQLAAHAPYSDEPNCPPAYNGNIQMTPQSMQTVIVVGEQPWTWSWCTLVTTVVGFFLCPLCGFVGTVFGLLSYTDHQNKEFNNARSKKNVALCCGIAACIISAFFFILIIALIGTGVNYASGSHYVPPKFNQIEKFLTPDPLSLT